MAKLPYHTVGDLAPPSGLQSKRSVRKRWLHLRQAVARRIRYKITRGGVLFSVAILVVAVGAIVSANNLLFLIVATMHWPRCWYPGW